MNSVKTHSLIHYDFSLIEYITLCIIAATRLQKIACLPGYLECRVSRTHSAEGFKTIITMTTSIFYLKAVRRLKKQSWNAVFSLYIFLISCVKAKGIGDNLSEFEEQGSASNTPPTSHTFKINIYLHHTPIWSCHPLSKATTASCLACWSVINKCLSFTFEVGIFAGQLDAISWHKK